jgi:hypothetical protein
MKFSEVTVNGMSYSTHIFEHLWGAPSTSVAARKKSIETENLIVGQRQNLRRAAISEDGPKEDFLKEKLCRDLPYRYWQYVSMMETRCVCFPPKLNRLVG